MSVFGTELCLIPEHVRCASSKVVYEPLIVFQLLINLFIYLICPVKYTNRCSCDSHMTKSLESPDWVVPHDVPGKSALLHGIGENAGDIVDRRDETPTHRRQRDASMDTEYLGGSEGEGERGRRKK